MGKKVISGYGLFNYFPDSYLEDEQLVRTPENDKVYEQIKILNFIKINIEKIIRVEYPEYSRRRAESLRDYIE